MKKSLFLLLLSLAGYHVNAQKPNLEDWGIGVRLGDPTGITAKKYLDSKHAIEFNVGRTWYWGYDYESRFGSREDRIFINYGQNRGLCLQAHYLWNQELVQVLSGLQWYYGLGPQLRFNSYRYRFFNNQNQLIVFEERRTHLGIGVDGVTGLEYTFDEVPITVFADIALYIEALTDPFWFTFHTGVGARYRF